jgi:hypothetical protein
MVTLLRQLKGRLSDTLDAWATFQQKDMGYFLVHDPSPISSSSLQYSVEAVEDVFFDLKGIHKKLRLLEEELCQDNPQGASSQPSLFARNQ